jgi:hypothetical protein
MKSRRSFEGFDKDAPILPATPSIKRSSCIRAGPAKGNGWYCRAAREHDVNPARFHHPFQPMVAILSPPFAGSIRARHLAHTRRNSVEFGEGFRRGGSLAKPRMPDR